jgi:hypothetical protein
MARRGGPRSVVVAAALRRAEEATAVIISRA